METKDLIIDDISPELLDKIKQLFIEEKVDFERKCRIETVIEPIIDLPKTGAVGDQPPVSDVKVVMPEVANVLPSKRHTWYEELLEKTVAASRDDAIRYATVVSFPEGVVLGTYPKDFQPDKEGVLNIIAALQGDTKKIAEEGMLLGPGCKVAVPGKLDPGKGIYGTDTGEGGTDAFRSKENLLIASYVKGPATSTRLLRKTAQYMEDQGR